MQPALNSFYSRLGDKMKRSIDGGQCKSNDRKKASNKCKEEKD